MNNAISCQILLDINKKSLDINAQLPFRSELSSSQIRSLQNAQRILENLFRSLGGIE